MNKKNILPIIVLVVLVVVYVIIRTNDRTEKRVRFFQVDSLQLGFFEIFSGEDSLKLSWEEDQWMIVSPVYFPPADNKIADFFQKILPVGTSSIPISETESALTTYDVADSQGTRVLLYDREGKLQQEAIIGKSSNYNYAYGRNKGNTRVYQLSANITYQLKPTLSPWRKKEIIDIEEEDIAAIHVTYGDTVYTISPTDSLWQYQSGDREFAIPEKNAALLALLNNTRRLRASSFADGEYDTYREDLNSPLLEVVVERFDNDPIRIRFAAYQEDKFVVMRNEESEYLYVVFEHMVNNFRKSAADFQA